MVRAHARTNQHCCETRFTSITYISWQFQVREFPAFRSVSKHFCTIERSWKFAQMYSSSFGGAMAVFAPDSSQNLEMCEVCISSVVRDVGEEQKSSRLQ